MKKIVNVGVSKEENFGIKRLHKVFDDIRSRYQSKPCPTYSDRIKNLKRLKRALLEQQMYLIESLERDYGFRSRFDTLICDILPTVNHINYTISHLRCWMKPSARSVGLLLFPSRTKVYYQPLGIVGVIVPWNFPIVLSVIPIVTAIASGNQVMVKLSEHTPNTNSVLNKIFSILNSDISIIEGGSEIASSFSQLPFDHLIFTGSTHVGRTVAQVAAKNLTPVTLELGGKSPAIVAYDVNLKSAVDAIMLGKSINAGQICVAPDYVFVPEGKEQEFIHLYLKRFNDVFSKKKRKKEMTHIINTNHYKRLENYLSDAKAKGGNIHTLKGIEIEGLQMMPHLVTNITNDMILMKEEIFGPILPILNYQNIKQVFEYISSRPRPLALYLMSNDKMLQRKVIEETHSGGVCFNETLLHFAIDDSPFGGVGNSGVGHYHGVEGFKEFSKAKTVLFTPSWLPRSRIMLRWRCIVQKILAILFIR
ncbi:aldehyde dehydrogenase [Candidatus Photodesmus blepharus]|uniref:Aldehyde dehydrogenase n=1 Tax=Candidatus Photodesmus blepharonis TaxID=1179155 RepID=A0A084CMY9_9GAMM|nr:coniferyl aldehyde dehydrogenase [Candidatus Photodesmus blepharus]KEY91168.1 aldehyde dehydrogenase [Candidatus Photodesmus blepharus]